MRTSWDRATYYYHPREESEFNLKIMRLIDEEYTRHPLYGSRRMTICLHNQGLKVGGDGLVQ
jgi:putative transposase